MVKAAPPLAPVFLVLLLAWARLVRCGQWTPHIEGCYISSREVIRVSITPPLAEASNYYVCAERWDDNRIYFDDSTLVSQSDTKVVYDVTGISSEKAEYIILVRPRNRHGDFLDGGHFRSSSIFSVPSDACSIALSSAIKMTSSSSSMSSSSTSTASLMSSSSSSKSTTTTVKSSVVEPLEITIGTGAPESVGSSTASDPSDHGFHMEKWVIVTLAVIIVLFFVFVGVMVYVGRGCSTRNRRRLSFRSRTSQEGTMSETLPPLEMASTLPLQPCPPQQYQHPCPQQQQQYEKYQYQQQYDKQYSSNCLLPEAEQDNASVDLLT